MNLRIKAYLGAFILSISFLTFGQAPGPAIEVNEQLKLIERKGSDGELVTVLQGFSNGEPVELELHKGALNFFELSSDGSRLITVGSDGKKAMSDLTTGKLLFEFEDQDDQNRPRFSTDGSLFVATAKSRFKDIYEINIHDSATGEILHSRMFGFLPSETQFVADVADLLSYKDTDGSIEKIDFSAYRAEMDERLAKRCLKDVTGQEDCVSQMFAIINNPEQFQNELGKLNINSENAGCELLSRVYREEIHSVTFNTSPRRGRTIVYIELKSGGRVEMNATRMDNIVAEFGPGVAGGSKVLEDAEVGAFLEAITATNIRSCYTGEFSRQRATGQIESFRIEANALRVRRDDSGVDPAPQDDDGSADGVNQQ